MNKFNKLLLSSVISLIALSSAEASRNSFHDINNNNNVSRVEAQAEDKLYESFAIQLNLDDASADRVFNLGNDIYQGVNGNAAEKKPNLGRLFTVEEVVKTEKTVELQHKEGRLQGQTIIDPKTKKPVTRVFINEKKNQHNVFLACEQTTASPHATVTVYDDANDGKLTANRIEAMHGSLDVLAKAMAAQSLTSEAGVQLDVKNLVLIASFLEEQQKDELWTQDSCALRAQKPKRNNVYYRFNDANELVDEFGGKFTEVKKDMARAFIVLECEPSQGDDTGSEFLNNLNGTLKSEVASDLSPKKYAKPLLHVTLAKLAGTKDSGKFRRTSQEDLLFPIRGCREAFEAIQRLVKDAHTNLLNDCGTHGSVISCDKLVINPVQVSDGNEKPVLSFKPEHKRDARGKTDWSEYPRRSVLLKAIETEPEQGRGGLLGFFDALNKTKRDIEQRVIAIEDEQYSIGDYVDEDTPKYLIDKLYALESERLVLLGRLVDMEAVRNISDLSFRK